MNNVLHIDTSPQGSESVSRQITAAVVKRLKAVAPGATVKYRDLAAAPITHLSGELLRVLRPVAGTIPLQSDAVRKEVALTEELLEELLAAEVLVIGAPMYNFSVTSQLKVWIDRVLQAGRTFRYTADGLVGLAGGKKVIIASTRGGAYCGTPHEAMFDHQEAYLRTILNFMGMVDISYVRAEGLALGAEKRREALASADREIASVQASPLVA